MKNERDIENLLDSLAKTKFRGSFHLNRNMQDYTKEKGIDKIREDAYSFIEKRLAPANPANDGKQTPMRANSHPVFIAQHATGFCCRGCAERIHGIPKGRTMTKDEIDYAVKVIILWIERETGEKI